MLRNSKNAPYGKDSNFKANKNSGDKPDSVKKIKWLKEASTLQKLEALLAGNLKAIADKNLSKEEYKVLADAADKLIKNIQLLGGKPTEIIDDYANFTTEEIERRINELEKGTIKAGVGQAKT